MTMTFDIYLMKEGLDAGETLLATFSTPLDVINYCQAWMEENEFDQSSLDWVNFRLSWEDLEAREVRETDTYQMARYMRNGSGKLGLKVIQTNTSDPEPEPEPE